MSQLVSRTHKTAQRQQAKRGDLSAVLNQGLPFQQQQGTPFLPYQNPTAPDRNFIAAGPSSKLDIDQIIGQVARLNQAAIDPATGAPLQGQALLRALGNTGDLGAGAGGQLGQLFELLQRQQQSGDISLTSGDWLDQFVQAMTAFQAANAQRNQGFAAAMGLAPLQGTAEAQSAQQRAQQLLASGGGFEKPGQRAPATPAPQEPSPIQRPPQSNAQGAAPAPTAPAPNDIATALSPAGGIFGPNGSRRFFYGNTVPIGGQRRPFGSRTYL